MEEKNFYQENMTFSYTPNKQVEVIRVIRTELELRGKGTEKEPYRRVEQFWSLAGDLLWENDPYMKSKQKKDNK